MGQKVQPLAVVVGRRYGCNEQSSDQSRFRLGNRHLSFKGNIKQLLIFPL